MPRQKVLSEEFQFDNVFEKKEEPNTCTTNSGPYSARQRNAIKMAFRWQADDGPALKKGIRPRTAKKPYNFVIYQRGRALDWGLKGFWLESHRRHWVLSLNRTLYPLLSTGSSQAGPTSPTNC